MHTNTRGWKRLSLIALYVYLYDSIVVVLLSCRFLALVNSLKTSELWSMIEYEIINEWNNAKSHAESFE